MLTRASMPGLSRPTGNSAAETEPKPSRIITAPDLTDRNTKPPPSRAAHQTATPQTPSANQTTRPEQSFAPTPSPTPASDGSERVADARQPHGGTNVGAHARPALDAPLERPDASTNPSPRRTRICLGTQFTQPLHRRRRR